MTLTQILIAQAKKMKSLKMAAVVLAAKQVAQGPTAVKNDTERSEV